MKLTELTAYLSSRLELETYQLIDDSLNGLQVGRAGKEVRKVVCAVDASLATFQAAVEAGADAIFVHHGLFWGNRLQSRGLITPGSRFCFPMTSRCWRSSAVGCPSGSRQQRDHRPIGWGSGA